MVERFPARPAIGAVIYHPDNRPEQLLADFADELSRRGFRVGGLVQQSRYAENGGHCIMEVRELDTGRHTKLTQDLGEGSASCALDPSVLAEVSGSLRRAVTAKADVVFASKFSKAEQAGGGLVAEMLQVMADGLPLLTCVNGALIDDWTRFTGGMGDLLMPTQRALWRWWGPERLYDDLILGVGDGAARRVVIGQNWTMVEGPDGVGLALTPARNAPGHGEVPGGWTGQPLKRLAALARSWNPLEAAVGMAAIGAHNNRYDLDGSDVNGLEALDCDPAGVVAIGAFPALAKRLPGVTIIDRTPAHDQFPAEAATWALPRAQGVVITASTLSNHSAPSLLRLVGEVPLALVGPSTPLSRRLLSYGPTVLSGLVATDPDGLARVIAEGGGTRDLKPFGRRVTLFA